MSRIGRLPIILPNNVRFDYRDSIVSVEGPKGKLEKVIRFDGEIVNDGKKVTLINKKSDSRAKALHGLVRSLVSNMVIGVSEGYRKSLKILGVGYKAQLQGKVLILSMGYSHAINYQIPKGITIEVPDPNTIIVYGIDKEQVGQVTADIRKFKLPEPYKGKGIMYFDEIIRRKAGKAGVK